MIKDKLFLAAVSAYDSKTEESYNYYMIISAKSYTEAMEKIEKEHYPEIEDIMTVKLELMEEDSSDTMCFFEESVYKKLRGENVAYVN